MEIRRGTGTSSSLGRRGDSYHAGEAEGAAGPFSATFRAMSWSESHIPDLSGRTFVVTGANSGIGFEAARALAERGADVVLACRSPKKADDALAAIRTKRSDARVKTMALDLSSLASVRAFADAFSSTHARLDGLLNNAGLMAVPFARTADGFEMQLGTNHLGHFALTARLFPKLAATPGARIVTVASYVHRFGRIRWDDLMFERGYDRWGAYFQSKLANLLFTFELSRRLREKHPAVRATAAHPGYAATSLQAKGAELRGSPTEGFIMRLGNGLLAQDAAAGALPTLRATVDPEAECGDYFGPSGLFEMVGSPRKVGTAKTAKDPEAAERLWKLSEDLTGLRFEGL